MDEKMPPANVRAEKSVLGAVLRWNAALSDVAEILAAGDFYTFANQRIFESMLQLADAGKPIDLVTVADDLHARGLTPDVPYGYLAELWDHEPTGANATWHADLVRQSSVRRQLRDAGKAIYEAAQAGTGSSEEMLEAAEAAVFRIADAGRHGQAVPLSEALDSTLERIERTATGKLDRAGDVPTGFVDLDLLLNGLHPGELTLVAARPGVGKSAFGVNLLHNAAVGSGVASYLVSLEMSQPELTERLLACHTRIDGKRFRTGCLTPEQWEKLADARRSLGRCNVHIDDTPCQRMFRVMASARRMKARNNVGLVVLDYLQLVEPENRKEPRQEQVAGISRRLKLMARELNVPVVVMAQLNRGPEERAGQRPRLSDLRESGSQEQDADNVLLLHRDEQFPGTMTVVVAKQRNGPTGDVLLTWVPHCMRFENYATNN